MSQEGVSGNSSVPLPSVGLFTAAASVLPSGDNARGAYASLPAGVFTSVEISPVFTSSRLMSSASPGLRPPLTNRYLPSGVHSRSTIGLSNCKRTENSASLRSTPPSAGTSITATRSCSVRRTNARKRPSGDHATGPMGQGIGRQTQWRAGANQLHVDIEVVLVFPIPRERHRIPIRRQHREHLSPGVGRERQRRHRCVIRGDRSLRRSQQKHRADDRRGNHGARSGRRPRPSRYGSRRRRRDGGLAGIDLVLELVERDFEVSHRLHATCGILAQAAHHEARQLGGQVFAQISQRARLFAQHVGQHRRVRVALEGALAAAHFVEHGAEGENIRTRIEWLGFRLLGRHVGRRADDDTGRGLRHLARQVARLYVLIGAALPEER